MEQQKKNGVMENGKERTWLSKFSIFYTQHSSTPILQSFRHSSTPTLQYSNVFNTPI